MTIYRCSDAANAKYPNMKFTITNQSAGSHQETCNCEFDLKKEFKRAIINVGPTYWQGIGVSIDGTVTSYSKGTHTIDISGADTLKISVRSYSHSNETYSQYNINFE